MKFTSILTLTLLVGLLFSSCKKDPEVPNEEELITTVQYTLTSSTTGNIVTLSYTDLDGDNGDDPIVVGGTLEANTIYDGALKFLNEIEVPQEDITEEIMEEDEEHQLFFSSSLSDLSVDYDDSDANGFPLGLSTKLTTGSASTGTLTVILKHEPIKDAENVQNGDITNAGGDTDIQVTFPIVVE